MSVNPYTLQCLYEKGILDYVPYDLMGGVPMGTMSSTGINPYMQMAAQGGLYQNYGAGHDSFTHSSDYISASATPGIYSNYGGYNNIQAGSLSQTSPIAGYTSNGIGMRGGYGSGIGAYNNQNALGINGDIGAYNRQNILGLDSSLNDVSSGVSSGFRTASSAFNSTPKIVKDVLAAGIAILGVMLLIKKAKKPKATNSQTTSFISKMNPKNWKIFKK